MVTRVDKYLGGLGIDATGKLEVTDNASVVVGNGSTTGNVYAGTINSGGVELRANDYATLLSARSNDFNTYSVVLGGLTGANTAVVNLQTGLTGTNTNLSGNVAIFNGAFTGSNTRLSGAESNVISLQGGLSGTNTNLSGNVAIFTGAFTGSNTRLSGAESNVISLQGGLSGANTAILNLQTGLSGTNTNLSGNVAIFVGAHTGSNTRISGTESNVISLQGGLTGANTAIAAITSSPVIFQSNVTILGNLTLSGNTTIVTSNTISFGDTLLSLGANNTVSDNLDIGLYGHYWNGTANSHSGIFRSAVSKDWMLFANYTIDLEGNSTVTISNSSFQLGTLRVANANAGFNVSAANAILGTSVYSGAVELRANDYATILAAYSNDGSTLTTARSNDYSTYLVAAGGISGANTNITALTGGLTGANTNITALTGGLAGANTNITALTGGLAGANTNITALTGGLTGANTNITALTGGLSGANTNITNLTSGLTGANTNITALTGGLAGANTAIALRALAASPTFTGNAIFDTSTFFVDSLNDRVGIGTDSPGYLLDVRGTANVGALTTSGTVTLGSNTNVKITGGTNGQVLATDGSGNLSYVGVLTAASPTFTGNATFDTNTLFVDSLNDRVGIGTTSPTAKFHVAGTGTAARIIVESTGTSGSNLPSLYFNRTSNVSSGADQQGALVWSRTLTDSTSITSSIQSLGTNISGSQAMNMTYNAYTSHQFQINASEKMRIDSSGNVGIGADSTAYKLDVRGTANTGALTSTTVSSGGVELRANDYATYLMALGGLTGANTNITNQTTGLTGANTNITNLTSGLTGANTNITALTGGLAGANTAIALRALAASPTFTGNATFDTTTLFVDSLNDRVGIGTSSPSDALSVARSSGEAVISITNSGTASSWLTLSPGSSGSAYIHNTGNTSTIFTTNGSERMRIDSSGNLLVGTSSTGYKLDVRGSANVGALTTSGTVTLGSNTNVKITGGSANQYLQTDGSGNLSYATVQGVPVASIIMYGANTAPSGWLVCDGTAVSRSTYSGLFGVVSNVFGIGDNSTTFNLPDFRGRSPYGVDASQSITIGAKSAGKINVNFQTATGTGTSGSGGPTTHTLTTVNYQQPAIPKDGSFNALVSGVTDHTAHTHTVPALTVTHTATIVQFIIKT